MHTTSTNLLRTGVGVESIHHLHEFQSTHRHEIDDNGQNYVWFTTRGTPTRANDLINGGSIYWIIKKQISVRQAIIDIQTHLDDTGKKYCLIMLNPQLHMTSPMEHRHIQGWRYLPMEKAPKDLRPYCPNDVTSIDDSNIDPQMAQDLAEIGLL